MSGDLLQQAEASIARGDLFSAYDAATAAIEAGSEDFRFKYIQVLALARMGDGFQARERYDKYDFSASRDVDIAALGARLLKDEAWSHSQGDAMALLAASDAYDRIYSRTGDTFPGVNAATLALLGGAQERARARATEVLAKLDTPEGYYACATKAEALLVCGRIDEACKEITKACAQPDAAMSARATTQRQFAVLAAHLELPAVKREALLAPLKPPSVSMFCGHIMPGADRAAEGALAESIGMALDAEGVRVAYGALASGADIIIAEQLLKRGAELNVVLPFHQQDFIRESVLPAGESWIVRFNACLERAQTVTMATDMPYMDDPAQFTYGSLICMGLARLRAQHLGTDAVQVAVWDGVEAEEGARAGTAVDVVNWRRSGGRTHVVSPTWKRLKRVRPAASIEPPSQEQQNGDEVTREMRAIVFTDFRGFTKLQEPALPLFWRQVMRRMMNVLDRHGDAICYRNTWGDALYAVVADTKSAAELTIELQQSLTDVDYAIMGLDKGPHMRVGAHFGPVFRAKDASEGTLDYYGTQVSRTARIEPVTPPGAVYVTEQFAATLAIEAPEAFVCRYVGPVRLAKGYGALRMYLLNRRAG